MRCGRSIRTGAAAGVFSRGCPMGAVGDGHDRTCHGRERLDLPALVASPCVATPGLDLGHRRGRTPRRVCGAEIQPTSRAR